MRQTKRLQSIEQGRVRGTSFEGEDKFEARLIEWAGNGNHMSIEVGIVDSITDRGPTATHNWVIAVRCAKTGDRTGQNRSVNWMIAVETAADRHHNRNESEVSALSHAPSPPTGFEVTDGEENWRESSSARPVAAAAVISKRGQQRWKGSGGERESRLQCCQQQSHHRLTDTWADRGVVR